MSLRVTQHKNHDNKQQTETSTKGLSYQKEEQDSKGAVTIETEKNPKARAKAKTTAQTIAIKTAGVNGCDNYNSLITMKTTLPSLDTSMTTTAESATVLTHKSDEKQEIIITQSTNEKENALIKAGGTNNSEQTSMTKRETKGQNERITTITPKVYPQETRIHHDAQINVGKHNGQNVLESIVIDDLSQYLMDVKLINMINNRNSMGKSEQESIRMRLFHDVCFYGAYNILTFLLNNYTTKKLYDELIQLLTSKNGIDANSVLLDCGLNSGIFHDKSRIDNKLSCLAVILDALEAYLQSKEMIALLDYRNEKGNNLLLILKNENCQNLEIIEFYYNNSRLNSMFFRFLSLFLIALQFYLRFVCRKKFNFYSFACFLDFAFLCVGLVFGISI